MSKTAVKRAKCIQTTSPIHHVWHSEGYCCTSGCHRQPSNNSGGIKLAAWSHGFGGTYGFQSTIVVPDELSFYGFYAPKFELHPGGTFDGKLFCTWWIGRIPKQRLWVFGGSLGHDQPATRADDEGKAVESLFAKCDHGCGGNGCPLQNFNGGEY